MKKAISIPGIQTMILELRGQKVILDRDIAYLYGAATRALLQAVKRNRERFPKDFVFQLNDDETFWLVSQNVIPHKKYFGGRNPYVFTRNGAKISTHSRAIMHLFQKDKTKTKEIKKVKLIVREMVGLLQRVVFRIKD